MSADPSGAATVDRGPIARDLDACRVDLHQLLARASPERLRAGTEGTAWTNEQLLFHMVFGYLIVRVLLHLVRLVSRLPPAVGRGFAALLDSGRRPFHLVNYLGSCAAALVFDHARMGPLCDRTIAALRTSLEHASDTDLRRGMPFPTTWDPYFRPVMTVADLYRYGTQHFEHHRRQLTLGRR